VKKFDSINADAILLVGHGTRHELGQRQFLRLAEHLRAAVAPLPVEVAYIELQQPTIEDALIGLHEHGLKNVLLSPALLFAAGHAKKDVPAAVESAKRQCPGLLVKLAEPLGCHDAVLELAALRVKSSLSAVPRGEGDPNSSLSSVLRGEVRGERPAPRTDSNFALVVVGRGSSDTEAIAHCQLFAGLLAQRLKINQVFTGFIAIAKPTLSEALAQVAQSGLQQVVVHPHLLFHGEMLETATAAVQSARRAYPQIDWRIAEILGSDLDCSDSNSSSRLVQALRQRLQSCSPSAR
jgi:sirohydrochlorin cobaltochelatase